MSYLIYNGFLLWANPRPSRQQSLTQGVVSGPRKSELQEKSPEGKAMNAEFGTNAKERYAVVAKSKGTPTKLVTIGLVALLITALSIACANDEDEDEPGAADPGVQAASIAELKQAQGEVFDWVQGPLSPSEPELVEWLITGKWVLDCKVECVNAALGDIHFGMALGMVRPGGERSHSHQFSKFLAKLVKHENLSDDLTIEGQISFTPIGPAEITIELVGLSKGNATFYFTLGEGSPFKARSGGVVIESR